MEPKKAKWSGVYTLVLVANVGYIILFYIIMKFFSE
jgi:hypothetical protein